MSLIWLKLPDAVFNEFGEDFSGHNFLNKKFPLVMRERE
jgi:hypothetical protein